MRKIMSIVMVLLLAASAVFAEGTFAGMPWGSSPNQVISEEGFDYVQDQTGLDNSRQITYFRSVLHVNAANVYVFRNNELTNGIMMWNVGLYGKPDTETLVFALDNKYGDRLTEDEFNETIDLESVMNPFADDELLDHGVWLDGEDTLIVYGETPEAVLLLYYDFDDVRLEGGDTEDSSL